MLRIMILKTLPLSLLIFLLVTSISMGQSEENAIQDTIINDDGIPKPETGYFSPVNIIDSDSTNTVRVFHIEAQYDTGLKSIKFEWHYSMLRFVKFKSSDKSALTSTSLVFGLALAIPGWTSVILKNDDIIKYTAKCIAIPFGAHIAFKPAEEFTVFAGFVPDFVFFTSDDGFLLRGEFGIRLNIKGYVLTLDAGPEYYWGFERDNRDLGWSFGIRLGVDPRHGPFAR